MAVGDYMAAVNELERLRGIVPEVLERLNDDLCAENERLRAELEARRDWQPQPKMPIWPEA